MPTRRRLGAADQRFQPHGRLVKDARGANLIVVGGALVSPSSRDSGGEHAGGCGGGEGGLRAGQGKERPGGEARRKPRLSI